MLIDRCGPDAIAAELGLSKSMVSFHLQRLGPSAHPIPRPSSDRRDTEHVCEILQRDARTNRDCAVAARLGLRMGLHAPKSAALRALRG